MMFAAILKMGAESIANPSKVVSYTPEVGNFFIIIVSRFIWMVTVY